MPRTVLDLTHYFLAHAREAGASLAAMLVVVGCFWAVGRLFSRREPAVAVMLGWAACYLIALLGALLGISDLRLALAISLLLALVSLLVHRPSLRMRNISWPALLLAAPLLVLGAFCPPPFWDSYMHWLPNALYLFQLGHFPAVPLAGFPSAHPTYPLALPLVIYFASQLADRFLEPAGTLTNVYCSLVAMSVAFGLIRSSLRVRLDGRADDRAMRIILTCGAFCAVILLNPSIQWVHYWSVIADPGLAVVVLIVIVRCCDFFLRATAQESAAAARAADDRADLISLFLLGVLMAGIKNSGWQLAVILAAAGALAAFLQGIALRRWLAPLVALVSGAVVAAALWNVYLSAQLPLPDQFSVRPLSAWHLDMAGQLAHAIRNDLFDHWQYYGLLIAAIVLGLWRAVRRTVPPSRLELMLTFAALAAVAHLAFLLLAYVGGGFADWEIARAASLQRYSTQVGFAVCALALIAVAVYSIERFPRAFQQRAVLAAGAVCLACIYAADLLYPSLQIASGSVRTVVEARALADKALLLTLPRERTALIGQKWSVLLAYYASWADIPAQRRPLIVAKEQGCDREDIERANLRINDWMSDARVDAIVLLDARELAQGLGLQPASDQIWRRKLRQWRVVDLGRSQASCGHRDSRTEAGPQP